MISLLIIFVIMYCGLLLFKNKVSIRFGTFLRKGFRKIKDQYGVYCWVGKQGDGKTYSVCDFIQEILGDKKVITNVKSYADNHKHFAIYEPNFYTIIDKFNSGIYNTNYIIFYDELFTLLEKGKLNKSVLEFISQLRKRGIYLLTTVQEWLDINVTFRRYCRFQIDCNMFNLFGLFAICINVIHDGYKIHWDKELNEYDAPVLLTTVKKCSLAVANSYDTYEVINKS